MVPVKKWKTFSFNLKDRLNIVQKVLLLMFLWAMGSKP